MPDGSVRAQLLAKVDDLTGRMTRLLEEVGTVTEQLRPERARSCRNAITTASVMVREPAAGPRLAVGRTGTVIRRSSPCYLVRDPFQAMSRFHRTQTGPVDPSADVGGGGRKSSHWPLLVGAGALLVSVAGSAALVMRDNEHATEVEKAKSDEHATEVEKTTSVKRPDSAADQGTPSASEYSPPAMASDCVEMPTGAVHTDRLIMMASSDESGLVPVPGPAEPPLVPGDAMAGVNQTLHGTQGQQTVEIHVPATRVADLAGERIETVQTLWGVATVWYAPYGVQDMVQVRVPLLRVCDVWDVTVRGPDVAANRALAIELVSGDN